MCLCRRPQAGSGPRLFAEKQHRRSTSTAGTRSSSSSSSPSTPSASVAPRAYLHIRHIEHERRRHTFRQREGAPFQTCGPRREDSRQPPHHVRHATAHLTQQVHLQRRGRVQRRRDQRDSSTTSSSCSDAVPAATTGSAVLSDITACPTTTSTVQKRNDSQLPEFTNDHCFRVYYRYSSDEDLALIPFESISEEVLVGELQVCRGPHIARRPCMPCRRSCAAAMSSLPHIPTTDTCPQGSTARQEISARISRRVRHKKPEPMPDFRTRGHGTRKRPSPPHRPPFRVNRAAIGSIMRFGPLFRRKNYGDGLQGFGHVSKFHYFYAHETGKGITI